MIPFLRCASILLVLSSILPAQAERPFKTDDPWQERLYGWEVQGGIAAGSGEWEKIESRNQFDVLAGFDYGLTERSEVGLLWNIFRMQDPGPDGFTDAAVHYKHRIAEASASWPDISLDLKLKLPLGDRDRALGSGKVDLGLASLFGWKSERWTTSFRLGYLTTGSSAESDRLELGLATRYRASEFVSFLGEIYNDSNEKPGHSSRLEVSAGMSFIVGPATWFDLMVTAGISESVPDAGMQVGMTSRL
ncbi:MAG: hypothetical protein AAB229_07880 [Candidatus Hydrogenedentota bacterium]